MPKSNHSKLKLAAPKPVRANMKPIVAAPAPVILMNATKWGLSSEASPIKNDLTIDQQIGSIKDGGRRDSSIQS
jgi:hypothetical protein